MHAIRKQQKVGFIQVLICLLFSILLSLPLYRPIFLELNNAFYLQLVYIVGFLSGVLILPKIIKYKLNTLDLCVYAFFSFSIFMSVMFSGVLPLNYLMLMGFLLISYWMGKWAIIEGKELVILNLVAICFIVVGLYVVYKLSLYNFDYHYYLRYSDAKLRVGYLTIGLYGFVAVITIWKTRLPLLLKLILCALSALIVLVSGARYSVLMLLLIFCYPFLGAIKHKSLRRPVLIGFPIIFLGIIYAVYKHGIETLVSYFSYTLIRINSLFSGEDNSVQGRENVMNKAVELIWESPILGRGIGSPEEIYSGSHPHNMLLEIMLETGVFSGILLMVVVLLAIKSSFSYYKIGLAYIGAIAIYLIGAHLKSFTFYDGRLLFFAIGCLSCHPKVIYNLRLIAMKNSHK